MKKLLSGLIAAFLLSAGFVAVSAETAQAACKSTQYVKCPATSTKASGAKTVKRGKKPKTTVDGRGDRHGGRISETTWSPGG